MSKRKLETVVRRSARIAARNLAVLPVETKKVDKGCVPTPNLEKKDDYEAFKDYCYDLVMQDNTSYRRMLYYLVTLFPGDVGCPMKLRPRKDWKGTLNDVFTLARRVQVGMHLWFEEDTGCYGLPIKGKQVLCLWFECTPERKGDELYLMFHRAVCQELGLCHDRAVAALVTWDERVDGNFIFEDAIGYTNLNVPEFYSDFYTSRGMEREEAWSKADQAFFQARQELYDKWKESPTKRKRLEEESSEDESSEESDESSNF